MAITGAQDALVSTLRGRPSSWRSGSPAAGPVLGRTRRLVEIAGASGIPRDRPPGGRPPSTRSDDVPDPRRDYEGPLGEGGPRSPPRHRSNLQGRHRRSPDPAELSALPTPRQPGRVDDLARRAPRHGRRGCPQPTPIIACRPGADLSSSPATSSSGARRPGSSSAGRTSSPGSGRTPWRGRCGPTRRRSPASPPR